MEFLVLKIEILRSVETSVVEKHRVLSHQIRVHFHHHLLNISGSNNFDTRCPVYIRSIMQHHPATAGPCDNLILWTGSSKIFTYLPSSVTHQRHQIQGNSRVAPPLRQQAVPQSPASCRAGPGLISLHFILRFVSTNWH